MHFCLCALYLNHPSAPRPPHAIIFPVCFFLRDRRREREDAMREMGAHDAVVVVVSFLFKWKTLARLLFFFFFTERFNLIVISSPDSPSLASDVWGVEKIMPIGDLEEKRVYAMRCDARVAVWGPTMCAAMSEGPSFKWLIWFFYLSIHL